MSDLETQLEEVTHALVVALGVVANCCGCIAQDEDGEFYRLRNGEPIEALNQLDPILRADLARVTL